MTTKFGEMPGLFSMAGGDFNKERIAAEEALHRAAMADITTNRAGIDINSWEWKAIDSKIRELIDEDYNMVLRRKGIEHGETEYARGAIDALERLLEIAGK